MSHARHLSERFAPIEVCCPPDEAGPRSMNQDNVPYGFFQLGAHPLVGSLPQVQNSGRDIRNLQCGLPTAAGAELCMDFVASDEIANVYCALSGGLIRECAADAPRARGT